MRPPYLFVVLSALGLALLEPASAADASSARFLVSLKATITKQWNYTSSQRSGGCRLQVAGSGTRRITLRSGDVSIVRVRWAGGASRVAFSGAIRSLSESIRQTGTKVTRTSGGDDCDAGVRETCVPLTRRLTAPRARLVSDRRHTLSFRRVRGLLPDAVFNDCPGEPAGVRAVTAGLALADTRLSERELFDRKVGGLTLEGSADAAATLLDRSARIVHHVRWTLTLRRLGG